MRDINIEHISVILTMEALQNPNRVAKSQSSESTSSKQILGTSLSFAINSIPTANVEVPLGASIEGGGDINPSWFYEELKDAVQERKAYGIYARITELDGMPSPLGKICLFRGYVTRIGMNMEHGIGTATVGLTHWLSDLDMLSILNPLSAPENPVDVATDTILDLTDGGVDTTSSGGRGKSSSWNPGQAAKQVVIETETVWDAIRAFLLKALEENKKTSDTAGGINDALYDKVKYILEGDSAYSMGAQDALVIHGGSSRLADNFDTGTPILAEAIGTVLAEQMRSEYYSVTAWQKLISVLLPQFYLAVFPAVDTVYIAPDPGLTCSMDWIARKIYPDTLISVEYSRVRESAVTSMILVSSPSLKIRGNKRSSLSQFQYPPPQQQKPGTIKAAYMPDWLASAQSISDMVRPTGVVNFDFLTPEPLKSDEPSNTDDASQESTNSVDIKQLCYSWVKGAYVNEVTKGNRLTLTTAFNPYVGLGDFVKITAKQDILSKQEPMTLYGIIQTVTHTLNKQQMTTTLSISNVRDEATQQSLPDLKGVIYAPKPIHGRLFVQEEEE